MVDTLLKPILEFDFIYQYENSLLQQTLLKTIPFTTTSAVVKRPHEIQYHKFVFLFEGNSKQYQGFKAPCFIAILCTTLQSSFNDSKVTG